jgi:hypothetical protein
MQNQYIMVALALGLYLQGIRLLRVVQLLKTLYLELSSGALHHAVSRYISTSKQCASPHVLLMYLLPGKHMHEPLTLNSTVSGAL